MSPDLEEVLGRHQAYVDDLRGDKVRLRERAEKAEARVEVLETALDEALSGWECAPSEVEDDGKRVDIDRLRQLLSPTYRLPSPSVGTPTDYREALAAGDTPPPDASLKPAPAGSLEAGPARGHHTCTNTATTLDGRPPPSCSACEAMTVEEHLALRGHRPSDPRNRCVPGCQLGIGHPNACWPRTNEAPKPCVEPKDGGWRACGEVRTNYKRALSDLERLVEGSETAGNWTDAYPIGTRVRTIGDETLATVVPRKPPKYVFVRFDGEPDHVSHPMADDEIERVVPTGSIPR